MYELLPSRILDLEGIFDGEHGKWVRLLSHLSEWVTGLMPGCSDPEIDVELQSEFSLRNCSPSAQNPCPPKFYRELKGFSGFRPYPSNIWTLPG